MVSVRLRSSNSKISKGPKEIIQKAGRQLLQDRVRYIYVIIGDNEGNINRCRSRILSLVTTTTDRYKCIEFINKVREARFIKVKNWQVNKFNRLVNKGREKASTH